jgi:hypothetical protein
LGNGGKIEPYTIIIMHVTMKNLDFGAAFFLVYQSAHGLGLLFIKRKKLPQK